MPFFVKTEIIKKEYLINKDLNFMQVVSSPLTRSSYHAEEIQKLMKKYPK